jgi:DNA-binding transcriptional LysR family regulator
MRQRCSCVVDAARGLADAIRKAGLVFKKLRVVMELDSTEAVKSASAGGLGSGFVSEWALSRDGTIISDAILTLAA